mgnify:CR=1 FL=1
MNLNKSDLYAGLPTSSRNYLRPDYLPQKFTIRKQTISKDTSYEFHDCTELLFIQSGHGLLVVNGTPYELGPGSCFLLSHFHFYKIIVTTADAITVHYALIPHTTFQFLLLSPGANFHYLDSKAVPPHCVFDTAKQKISCPFWGKCLPQQDMRTPFADRIAL